MLPIDILEFVPIEETSSRTIEILQLLNVNLHIAIDPPLCIHVDQFVGQLAEHDSILKLSAKGSQNFILGLSCPGFDQTVLLSAEESHHIEPIHDVFL